MTDAYAVVLADLEAKRAQVDAAIAAIKGLSPHVEAVAVKHSRVGKSSRRHPACRFCHQAGHNALTCPTKKPDGASRKCKKCGDSGHNVTTCPGVDTGKVLGLLRRCPDCAQRTPAKGACNHCGAKESAA